MQPDITKGVHLRADTHFNVVPGNPWDVEQVAKATAGTALQKEIAYLHCLICRPSFTASVRNFCSKNACVFMCVCCYLQNTIQKVSKNREKITKRNKLGHVKTIRKSRSRGRDARTNEQLLYKWSSCSLHSVCRYKLSFLTLSERLSSPKSSIYPSRKPGHASKMLIVREFIPGFYHGCIYTK